MTGMGMLCMGIPCTGMLCVVIVGIDVGTGIDDDIGIEDIDIVGADIVGAGIGVEVAGIIVDEADV